MITTFKIFESTDHIISKIDNRDIDFVDYNSYAFTIDENGEIYFGRGMPHSELIDDIIATLDTEDVEYGFLKYNGRIFYKDNVIAFWDLEEDYDSSDFITYDLIDNIITEFNYTYDKDLDINTLLIEVHVENDIYFPDKKYRLSEKNLHPTPQLNQKTHPHYSS